MRYGLLVLVAVIVAAVSVALSVHRGHNAPQDMGRADIGGSFALTDQNNRPFTEENLKGSYSIVYFGFTHCPDICPVGLSTISETLNAMGAEGKKITPVFITVDAKRDTPAQMKKYAANFHPRLVALTGDEEALKEAQQAYKVYASPGMDRTAPANGAHDGHADHSAHQTGGKEDGYLMNHSGYMYLMDAQGRYLAHYPHDISAEKLAASLRSHLHAGR